MSANKFSKYKVKTIIILKLFLLTVLFCLIGSCSDDNVIVPPVTDKDTSSVFAGNWVCNYQNQTDTLDYFVSINYQSDEFYGSASLNLISLFKISEDSSQVRQFIQTGKITITASDTTIYYYFSADSSFNFNGKFNPSDTTISGELQAEDATGMPRILAVTLKKK